MNRSSTDAKKENFKKFCHKECEYFPCHDVKNAEEFNCLFCYCPLYALGSECGGNYTYKDGIKDCSKCLIPHTEGGYEYIIKKFALLAELAAEK